jgi:hypothetical protein
MANSADTKLDVPWLLVGDRTVRHALLDRRASVGDLLDAAGRSLSLAPAWLRASLDGEDLDDETPAWEELDDIDGVRNTKARGAFLISLLLPAWARLSVQPWIPRKRRHRVCNQPAVRDGAWQPGLLLHETIDAPSGKGSHPEERDSFPVFIEGIPELPAPFLRIELGAQNPTVGLLRRKLEEVTGRGFLLANGESLLGAPRQYLHRVGGIEPGSVITASVRSNSNEPESDRSPVDVTAFAARFATQCRERPCSEGDASAEGVCTKLSQRLVHAGKGGLWAGSSRRRLLSTGSRPGRGEVGTTLQSSLSEALLDTADAVEVPVDRAGGYFQGWQC